PLLPSVFPVAGAWTVSCRCREGRKDNGCTAGAENVAHRLKQGRLMPVPVSQMWTVASYVLDKRLRGVKRYPLVLMLEPLFRCNLACAGCGKIQFPADILKKHLTPEQCFRAVDECGAPMVSIPGGEPLLHPQIGES